MCFMSIVKRFIWLFFSSFVESSHSSVCNNSCYWFAGFVKFMTRRRRASESQDTQILFFTSLAYTSRKISAGVASVTTRSFPTLTRSLCPEWIFNAGAALRCRSHAPSVIRLVQSLKSQLLVKELLVNLPFLCTGVLHYENATCKKPNKKQPDVPCRICHLCSHWSWYSDELYFSFHFLSTFFHVLDFLIF